MARPPKRARAEEENKSGKARLDLGTVEKGNEKPLNNHGKLK